MFNPKMTGRVLPFVGLVFFICLLNLLGCSKGDTSNTDSGPNFSPHFSEEGEKLKLLGTKVDEYTYLGDFHGNYIYYLKDSVKVFANSKNKEISISFRTIREDNFFIIIDEESRKAKILDYVDLEKHFKSGKIFNSVSLEVFSAGSLPDEALKVVGYGERPLGELRKIKGKNNSDWLHVYDSYLELEKGRVLNKIFVHASSKKIFNGDELGGLSLLAMVNLAEENNTIIFNPEKDYFTAMPQIDFLGKLHGASMDEGKTSQYAATKALFKVAKRAVKNLQQ